MVPQHPVREEAVARLASRLSNTGRVLDAWAEAMGGDGELLERRLRRAVRELEVVVTALTAREDEFLALERREPLNEGDDPRPASSGGALVKSGDDDGLGMRGRSEVISFIEFVAFLSSLGKNGVLQVQTGSKQFIIELRGDCVVYATVEPEESGQRLGEILMARNALSTEALIEGRVQARADEFLGEALLRQELITPEALRSALTEQVLQVFHAAHRVGAGFDFQFEENTRIMVEPDVRLGISHVLLESARLFDESRRDCKAAVERDGNAEALRAFRARLEGVFEGEEIDLPVLPDATGQLMALCWSDDFDAEQLLECVHHDQSLCAHLLRIANSAAYAPVTPISSIQLAITRLGLDKLREVAMALTLKQKVFQLPGWEDVIRSLWRTAAVTGGFASAIGKTCGMGAARGSMGGLLLDVGKPIVLNALYEIARELEAELSPFIADTLMQEYHTRVGDLLADQWSLPEWLTDVMRHHHDYDSCTEYRTEALIGHLASEFAEWAQAPSEPELGRLIDLPAAGELGLDRNEALTILKGTKQILAMAKLYS